MGLVSQAYSNEPPHGARKLLETPRVGKVSKVLEKLGGIHTILHYGGRHERSLGLSREFQKSLIHTCI